MSELLSPRTQDWIEDYLDQTCAPMVRRKSYQERMVIREELRSHLIALVKASIELGMDEGQAVAQAIRNMGKPRDIARSFGQRLRIPWSAVALATSVVILGFSVYIARPKSETTPNRSQEVATANHSLTPFSHRDWVQKVDCSACHSGNLSTPASFTPRPEVKL